MTKLLLTIAHYPLVLCVLTQVKDQPCHLHVRRKQQKHHPLLHVHSLIHTKHLLLFFQRYFNLAAKLYMFIYIYIFAYIKLKANLLHLHFNILNIFFPYIISISPPFFWSTLRHVFFCPGGIPLATCWCHCGPASGNRCRAGLALKISMGLVFFFSPPKLS